MGRQIENNGYYLKKKEATWQASYGSNTREHPCSETSHFSFSSTFGPDEASSLQNGGVCTNSANVIVPTAEHFVMTKLTFICRATLINNFRHGWKPIFVSSTSKLVTVWGAVDELGIIGLYNFWRGWQNSDGNA
ncbi:hypothetical protein PR048_006117 [Dryococelus australis]|uniref:Uncharacterized protein n=1 Tax=Dryococelus australis TaxID=614101 RepID=A0ABQ9IA37_9NEOP|nr:hypothetical protein PR048_006117 [Dryococelus australis]